MKNDKVKKIVKESYSKIAKDKKRCCSKNKLSEKNIAQAIGYSESDLSFVPEANLGLGCGNPTAFASLKEGDIVLDLGSGPGLDCFLASKKVGDTGRVIGVDMTIEMIDKAKLNAEKHGFKNVEFRLGDIEKIPVDDSSIDVIISNCVINLAPDKLKVFKEAYRVLKNGGKLYVSDIVLLEDLSDQQKKDERLLAGCVAGALLKNDYLKLIKKAGFNVSILNENKDISKEQYQGIALESLSLEAVK